MLKASNKTGLVFFPAFDWAIDPTHPEREERLLYTKDQVFEEGLLDIEGITEFKPAKISHSEINRAHFCVPDIESVTTSSHFISAGGAKAIAEKIASGEIDKGFALVRPPGHHAMRVVHGGRGFCNINIEAIMIEYLRKEHNYKKIAIVDTDCHHGDGTQDIYWHDPDVLFISIHQDGRTLYPGSGFTNEAGGPNACGYNLNVPLPPNTSEEGYLYTIENCVLPVLEEFKPDMIINSAGQDNHYTDPITNMNFTAQGYSQLTTMLDPDIAVLEGGYSIEDALPYINSGIILAMAGLDYSFVKEPGYNPERFRESSQTMNHIKKVCENVKTVWNSRHDLRKKMYGTESIYKRSRNIMYDTDGIYERQSEYLTKCDDCGGALKIISESDRGWKITGIHAPVNVCGNCLSQAKQWYEESKSEISYFHNNSEDIFQNKKR
ncbi:MAG: histone deacetylase [Deltaproteobacteria bacterium]|nr:MAG: histone deacetylase [Deltaproteobacteria bacterium]